MAFLECADKKDWCRYMNDSDCKACNYIKTSCSATCKTCEGIYLSEQASYVNEQFISLIFIDCFTLNLLSMI